MGEQVVWWILYALAALMLWLHWNSRNAVWGGATLGFLIGVIVAIFRDGFDWWLVAKIVTMATLISTVTEWAPRLLSRMLQSSRSDSR